MIKNRIKVIIMAITVAHNVNLHYSVLTAAEYYSRHIIPLIFGYSRLKS